MHYKCIFDYRLNQIISKMSCWQLNYKKIKKLYTFNLAKSNSRHLISKLSSVDPSKDENKIF
jgi:hypothetical protein